MGFTTSSSHVSKAPISVSLVSNSKITDQEQNLSSVAETESMIDLSSLDLVNKDNPRGRSSSPLLAESDVSSVSTKSEDDVEAISELDILKARWKKMHEYLKKLESSKKA